MTTQNLPVPVEWGPVLVFSNPEELAVAANAQSQLMRLVADHKEHPYASQANHEEDQRSEAQFLWGQDFDTEPDVWELDEDYFQDGGIFGPADL